MLWLSFSEVNICRLVWTDYFFGLQGTDRESCIVNASETVKQANSQDPHIVRVHWAADCMMQWFIILGSSLSDYWIEYLSVWQSDLQMAYRLFLSLKERLLRARRERIATSRGFSFGGSGRALFLQLPHRLTTSSNSVFRSSFAVDIGPITPRNNFELDSQIVSPDDLKLPVPSPQKSAPLKGEWDTQNLLGVPSTILSFCCTDDVASIFLLSVALMGSPIIISFTGLNCGAKHSFKLWYELLPREACKHWWLLSVPFTKSRKPACVNLSSKVNCSGNSQRILWLHGQRWTRLVREHLP